MSQLSDYMSYNCKTIFRILYYDDINCNVNNAFGGEFGKIPAGVCFQITYYKINYVMQIIQIFWWLHITYKNICYKNYPVLHYNNYSLSIIIFNIVYLILYTLRENVGKTRGALP